MGGNSRFAFRLEGPNQARTKNVSSVPTSSPLNGALVPYTFRSITIRSGEHLRVPGPVVTGASLLAGASNYCPRGLQLIG
jgi:hypothetical protein